MILRSTSVSTVIISFRAMITVTQFLALVIICSALASASLQSQDRHEGTRLVGMQTNFLPVEHSTSRRQYQSDSSVKNNNGTELASYHSIRTRLRGMGWTLAAGKLTSEERRTEKKPVETGTRGAKGRVFRKHGAVKGAALSSLASKSKSLRPSSGIQTTLSSLGEIKVISKQKMDGLAFQELEITTKRSLKAIATRQKKEEVFSEPNAYKPAPPSATSGHTVQASPTPQSQTFNVSGSMPYDSNDAADLSDIIGMDYGRARRNPPIHNKAPEP